MIRQAAAVLAVGCAMLATESRAQATSQPAMSLPARATVARSAPARSLPAGREATAPAQGEAGATVTPSTALRADQGAAIAGLRASAGPPSLTKQYRADCGTDVNIASVVGDNNQNTRIDRVYVDRVTVLNLGRCQELQGPSAQQERR